MHSRRERREVHIEAPWKLGAGTLQLSVKARKQQAQQLPPACPTVCLHPPPYPSRCSVPQQTKLGVFQTG